MGHDTNTTLLRKYDQLPGTSLLESLAVIPEEEVWLASQKSPRTRLAYKKDVCHFMRVVGISRPEQLRQVDHRAVIAWEVHMRETEGLQNSTIRRRLSALSSLFSHLVRHGTAGENPVREVIRPTVNRQQGKTLAFSKRQSRAILDAPRPPSTTWLRDRAILAVGLQVGFRRAEIVGLKVRDLHMNRGFDSLWVTRKRNKCDSVAVHPEVAKRIRDYLIAFGHGDDLDGPLFRTVRRNATGQISRRHLAPDAVDRILKTFAGVVGIERGYSAHSMRATFITTALDNGANLEDVQRDVGHADPSTTKLYDRRGHNPEKSSSFFANY
jgi:site-specific recombinase XerD